MRKLVLGLVLCMVMSLVLPSFAQEKIPVLIINDEVLHSQGEYPVIKDEHTYVSVRDMANQLKVSITWDEENKMIHLFKGEKKIHIDVKGKSIQTSDSEIFTDCVILQNNRAMVPFEYMAYFFGYEIKHMKDLGIIRIFNQGSTIKNEDILQRLSYEIEKERANILQHQKKIKDSIISNQHVKTAYITFDDGPSKYTEEILQILKQYDAKATFFMLCNHIKTYPNQVKKMVNEGHSVGLHGVSHRVNLIYRSPKTVVDEMNETNDALKEVIGEKTNLIRVPYGSVPYMKKPYREAVYKAGYKLWDWNVDSKDSLSKNTLKTTVINNVKQQVKNKNTPVILMHERKWSVEALPQILSYLKQQGYEIVPIQRNQKSVNFWNEP